MLDLARIAEEAGFSMVTAPEHHFQAIYPSDPLAIMTAIATVTSTIRLGTTVFLLPLHHPVRVAEQVATLDEMSGGRASIGVGLGYIALEQEAFGSTMRDRGARMEEALEIVRLVLTEEDVSWTGRFYDIPPITVHPRPIQSPNPPIYVAGSSSTSVRRAARLGDAWLCSPTEPVESVVRWSHHYRSARHGLGKPADWALKRFAWIGSDRADIEESVLPNYVAGVLAHVRRDNSPADRALIARLDAHEDVAATEVANDRILWGTPEDISSQIRRYHDVSGCSEFNIAFGTGILSDTIASAHMGTFEHVAAMIRLFGAEVIPAFA